MLFAEVQSYNQPLIFKWCIILGHVVRGGCILLFREELSKAKCRTVMQDADWSIHLLRAVCDGLGLAWQGLLAREGCQSRSARLVPHSYFQGCLGKSLRLTRPEHPFKWIGSSHVHSHLVIFQAQVLSGAFLLAPVCSSLCTLAMCEWWLGRPAPEEYWGAPRRAPQSTGLPSSS